MYPMKFIPVYQERIWGGNQFQSLFGRCLPTNKTGESWELSSHENGLSIIRNGCYAGQTLNELSARETEKIFGSHYEGPAAFPLLIKLLDANDKLSVQVHPDDEAAQRLESGQGKTEAWYVVQAAPDAEIIYGLEPGITKEKFQQAMHENIAAVLHKVPVQTGDMIYVPAGKVHALCGGVVVYEVQQTSDITYRIYDYDRVGSDGKKRPLAVDKALSVIHFHEQGATSFHQSLLKSPYFTMEKLFVQGELKCFTADHFVVFCIISGSGEILSEAGSESVAAGDTLLIPACLGDFRVQGSLECLKII
jgi:mannose-6-phosphate isomerase